MCDWRLAELSRRSAGITGAAARLPLEHSKLLLSKEEDQWLKQVVEDAFCTRLVITPRVKTSEFVVRVPISRTVPRDFLSFFFRFSFFLLLSYSFAHV